MKMLFLFLDGIGLGVDDEKTNPFVRAAMPNLKFLLNDHPMTASAAPINGKYASLLALDACLGTAGVPQSATGQATLFTGKNIPAQIGYHYGPKPNPEIAAYLTNGSLFSRLQSAGEKTTFLNAYPPAYFASIASGRRSYAAIPLAVTSAGIPLLNEQDLKEGRAISADFSGQGWRSHLGLQDTPLLSSKEAGRRLASLAVDSDFSLFEYWLSDHAGHHQDMDNACRLLEEFDQTLGSLVDAWDMNSGLIVLTSDHGNLEDLSTRRHTLNLVPALMIGAEALRDEFCQNLTDISGITPAVLRSFSD